MLLKFISLDERSGTRFTGVHILCFHLLIDTDRNTLDRYALAHSSINMEELETQ